ncbi:MAG: hypothetical protein JXA06_07295 [Bacteroidetes bacterium]|nr:hypothetical protein [Bacteroidota bacterium]
MRISINSFTIICILLIYSPNVFAGDDSKKDVELQIEKLTLFKNGLGFIVSQASLPDDAKAVRISKLPIPTFGTFWIGYPKSLKLQNLVASMEESEVTRKVQSLSQLLQINNGRKVVIHTSDKDIEGTILSVKIEDEKSSSINPYHMNPRSSHISPEIIDQSYSNNLIMIKTAKGVAVIDPSSIQRAEFLDNEPVSVNTIRQSSPRIRINLEKPADGEKISVSYLTRGVTWMPGYLIDLSDSKTAKFSAHAIIINEVADFNDVQVQLVTGYPNIKFGDILNPIAKAQSLAGFMTSLSGHGTSGSRGNYMMTQQALMSNVASVGNYETEESAALPAYSTAAEGETAEDLFFYPVKNLTLLKNETAWIPLFTADMPYKHIYTWKIEDYINKDERYQSDRYHNAAEEIWHSCRLTNSLDMPLTTAAAEFMTNGEFIGQDVCYYTVPKRESTIRINKALNLLAEQAEVEIDRKHNAAEFHGYRYDLVTVRGELKIKNMINKSIDIEITKEHSGELMDSQPKCKDTKTAKGLKQVNPKHILTWNINMKPGEEQKLSYKYQVYIRN